MSEKPNITIREDDGHQGGSWELITASIKVFSIGGIVILASSIVTLVYETIFVSDEYSSFSMFTDLIPGIILILLCVVILISFQFSKN
jgi:hypothetical protein